MYKFSKKIIYIHNSFKIRLSPWDIYIIHSPLPTTIYVQNLSLCMNQLFSAFEILFFQTFDSKPFFDHFYRKSFVQMKVTDSFILFPINITWKGVNRGYDVMCCGTYHSKPLRRFYVMGCDVLCLLWLTVSSTM